MHERPLRVFYNASALPQQPAGAGVYTLELGRALAGRTDVSLETWAPRHPGFGDWRQTARGWPRRLAWETGRAGSSLSNSGADVYHGPHMFTPRTRVPSVVTVHDLTFFRMPARYGFAHRRYYRYLAGTAKRADRIIVPSAAVAGDVVRYLGVAPARIRVVAEAPRAGLVPAAAEVIDNFRRRHRLNGPYLVCLGTAEPGKRAVDAIRAMAVIRAGHPRTTLALAGNPGRLSDALRREVRRLGLEDSVRFLGYVPDEDLPALLTGATALVFPSLYEGFGLPPLEAMACGTPAIASDAPAMNEVLRGEATLVPLGDPAAIATAALRLLGDAGWRAERSASALVFARGFSWERAASETVEVYREVAG